VVPSSGVFTVRVARPLGGQPDLGLTVNEDLTITEVRRGSLAYRTGSLAPGDKLLAIDGQKLESGDLRQAAQLLHRPGSSVIALTVRKPDPNPETRYLVRLIFILSRKIGSLEAFFQLHGALRLASFLARFLRFDSVSLSLSHKGESTSMISFHAHS